MEKSTQLPKTIKLFNFAKKEVSLHGEYKISNVPRVSEVARNIEDNLKVNLSFHLENGKTPCVKGIITSKIVLDCQRCLDALDLDLKVLFNLAFVRYESQAEGLDKSYEVYVIGEDEEIDTLDLISDEILLSLPMAPSHEFDCSLSVDSEKIVEKVRENPFDVLKNIKIADFGKE
tara:strand:+ start:606 stop:1130 length:525 start_codon:yes stop_codon:yes gene_type:complete